MHYTTQKENEVLIEVELPGFSGDELDISTERGILSIQGQRNRKEVRLHFTIPRDVNTNAITAGMEHGILRITMPHAESSRKRVITLQQSQSPEMPHEMEHTA